MSLVRCQKCHGAGIFLRRGGATPCDRCGGHGRFVSLDPEPESAGELYALLVVVLVITAVALLWGKR